MDFEGRWKIVCMPDMADDYLELTPDPHIHIKKHNGEYDGEFHVGAREGEIWGIIESFGKEPVLVFCFEGSDEGDRVSGTGIFRIEGNNRLIGKLIYYYGDTLRMECERA